MCSWIVAFAAMQTFLKCRSCSAGRINIMKAGNGIINCFLIAVLQDTIKFSSSYHILACVMSVCETGAFKGLTVTSNLTRPSSRRRRSKSRCKTRRMADCSSSVRWLKSREASACSSSIPDCETKPQSLNRPHLYFNFKSLKKKSHLFTLKSSLHLFVKVPNNDGGPLQTSGTCMEWVW